MGIVILAPVVWSFRFLRSGKADIGIGVGTGAVFGGLLVGALVMFGYSRVAPDAFVYFGVSVIVGFVLALGVTAVFAVRWLFRDSTRSEE